MERRGGARTTGLFAAERYAICAVGSTAARPPLDTVDVLYQPQQHPAELVELLAAHPMQQQRLFGLYRRHDATHQRPGRTGGFQQHEPAVLGMPSPPQQPALARSPPTPAPVLGPCWRPRPVRRGSTVVIRPSAAPL